jgi:RNA 2',3'-cyclic 3'-phosphodiesterase
VFIRTCISALLDHLRLNHFVNNLFLAFVPEGHANHEVDGIAKQEKAEHHFIGNPLGLAQYHLSLIPFGIFRYVLPDLVSSIGKVFAPLAAATEPFTVRFDRARSVDTRKSRLPFVLHSSSTDKSLMEFYRKLTSREQGKRKPLKPHVTLLYDVKNIPEHRVRPVIWTVSELVLVRSYYGLGRHEHLARWPLLGKPSESVQINLPLAFD